jgi:hypothetical protein
MNDDAKPKKWQLTPKVTAMKNIKEADGCIVGR